MPFYHSPAIGIAHRIRKSPFFDATIQAGAKAFTVYNHMLLPLYYESTVADYWHLVNNVTLWDVAAQRQVELTGPDATRLAQYLTPRNLSKCKIGQGKYVPLVDENGGMINDPILLRLGENHYWLSLADSDVLLWAKGLAHGFGWDVTVIEPDVSPLAIQGPNSDAVITTLFGDDWPTKLRFFWFRETDLDGIPLVVAKSGWSKQGGYELYLRDGAYGDQLWERVAEAGRPLDIKPATPSTIERIESGLLSYGNDMTLAHNPFEIGLDKYCDLEQEADFVGKSALQRIKAEGIRQKLVGLFIDYADPVGNEHHWPLTYADQSAGVVTSATYSPRLERNIALAMVPIEFAEVGAMLTVAMPEGISAECTVTTFPFL